MPLRHYLIYATASGAEVERLERHLSNEPSAHGLSAAYVSIPPEATRRLDPLKLRQVEVADRSQRVRRRAVGKARRQRIEPRLIVTLQFHQLRHRLAPSLRAAAPVGGLAVSDLRCAVRVVAGTAPR